jgi:hypothetical protein
MLAWPAKGKLVKLAKACFSPGREPNSRSGAVTTSTLAIQVAAQIGGSGSPRLLCILIPGTSIRFVRVRSYDRPDRSIVTVQLDTSMCTLARESWRCATHQGRSSPSIVISGPFTESLGKSFETLARQSVSQANHDLAGRVQPN